MGNNTQINWSDTLSKFSSYEGTIAGFCIENNIKPHQLYYQRRKVARDNQPVFYGIKVNKKDISYPDVPPSKACLEADVPIKIELGKATIYIPSNDKLALENVLQIVMSTC